MTLPQAPSCRFWAPCGITGGGCCSKGLGGGRPSYGVCSRCQDRSFRGLGDVVAWLLAKTGIARVVKRVKGKACGACAKRQAKLNAIFPSSRTQS